MNISDLLPNQTLSMEVCQRQLITGTGPLPLTGVNPDQSDDLSCIEGVSVFSIIIALIGVGANLMNLAVFSAGVRYSPRTRFLMAVTISDILLLIFQLPQLIVTSQNGQVSASHRVSYGGYAILSYSLNFMLSACAIWLLVSMVIHHWVQTSSTNEMTDILSNEVNDKTQDKFTSEEFLTSNIAIAVVSVAACAMHFVKLFEFKINTDTHTPNLLIKTNMLRTKSYEIYGVIINIFVSFVLPFFFFLGTSIYYIYSHIQLRTRNAPYPSGQLLILSLSLAYIISHALTLYTRFLPLVDRKYVPRTTCLDKISELFILMFTSCKIILYWFFYEVYKYCLNRRLRRNTYTPQGINISMTTKNNAAFSGDTSFENPLCGLTAEETNDRSSDM